MWILFFILMTGLANADVYVMTDSNNAVVGLSEQNDMVVPVGNKVSTVKGNISNLAINGDATMYDFNKGSFSINIAKVQAKQAADVQAVATQTASDSAKASAIAKLTDAISKVEPKDVLTDEEIQALLSAKGN